MATDKKESIYEELLRVAGLKRNKGEADQAFRLRLQKAIGEEISNEDWESLSGEAQDWNNDAADAITAKKELPPIPGDPGVKEDEPEPTTRRRRGGAAEVKPYEPKVGDHVLVKTKRGKVLEGIIVELNDKTGTLNKDGEKGDAENDIDFPIEGSEVALSNTAKGAELEGGDVVSASKEAVDAERESKNVSPESQEPQVGDTLQVTTMRGKVIMGTLEEVGADGDFVLKDSTGEEHELNTGRIKETVIKLRKGTTANATTSPAPATSTRRRAGVDAPANQPGTAAADHDDGDSGNTSNEQAGGRGNSLGNRVRDYMMDHPGTSFDDLKKWLTKEKIEFREPTVKMLHKDSEYMIKGMQARQKK